MVGRWGMSDAIGPIAVTDGRQDGLLLPGASPDLRADPASWSTRRSAGSSTRPSDEVDRSSSSASATRLESLAHALLERETLDQAEAYEVAGVPLPESAAEAPAPA